MVALWLLGGLITLGALLWITGQLSGRLFGGSWPHVACVRDGLRRCGAPPTTSATRPTRGRPPPGSLIPAPSPSTAPSPPSSPRSSRSRCCSCAAFAIEGSDAGRHAGRAPRPSARSAFADPEPGRLILGRAEGRLVAAEPRQSAIVVGPTQTGKTTGFAIPAILEWQGPVVATSIKTDLLRETIAARSAISGAQHLRLRPHRQHRPSERGMDAAHGVPDLARSAARR